MKRLAFSISVLVLVFVWIYHTAATDYNPAINSVIGDISYVKKFGHLPARGTDENVRIKTHLAYAEMLLRKEETYFLDPQTKSRREALLNHLNDYWNAGIFPKNYERKNKRSPCFIDSEGNICAVGYLVEQSASRELAETINKDFKYAKIEDMDSKALTDWIKANGLTKEEAAIIQPSYGWEPKPAEDRNNTNYISPSYGISSSLLGGLNLAVSGLQFSTKSASSLSSKIGLLTGAAQTSLGLLSFPHQQKNANGQVISNESKKTLSMVNIGLGMGTVILSSWNLIAKKPAKEKVYSWDIFGMPLNEKETAVALSVRRKF